MTPASGTFDQLKKQNVDFGRIFAKAKRVVEEKLVIPEDVARMQKRNAYKAIGDVEEKSDEVRFVRFFGNEVLC